MSKRRTIELDSTTTDYQETVVDLTTISGVHTNLALLMEYFSELGDSDGCQLIAAIGKHMYDRAVEDAERPPSTPEETESP